MLNTLNKSVAYPTDMLSLLIKQAYNQLPYVVHDLEQLAGDFPDITKHVHYLLVCITGIVLHFRKCRFMKTFTTLIQFGPCLLHKDTLPLYMITADIFLK